MKQTTLIDSDLQTICTIAPDKDAASVREIAKPYFGDNVLSIPLSETGELPVTHWFCAFQATQLVIDKMFAAQNLSEMEVCDAKEFLQKRNLKVVNASEVNRKFSFKK